MKKLKGSLTVEAAIVLPIFLMAILSIVYIIKIMYIHESIQHGLSETANELAAYSYIMDKSEILDAQQEIYKTSSENLNDTNENIDTFNENLENLFNIIEGGNSYIGISDINKDSTFKDMYGSGNMNEYINDCVSTISKIKEEVIGNASEAYKNLNDIINSVDKTLHGIKGTLISRCIHDGLAVTNNFVGTKMAKNIFNDYISDEQYKKWYIVNGRDGMNFRFSRFMLDDEDIDLIVKYKLDISIPFPGIKDISMTQRVKVRGWTGNSDGFNSCLEDDNSEADEASEDDIIVYCVENSEVYHTYITCLNNITMPETYDSDTHSSKLCETCAKSMDKNHIKIVYHTPEGKVYHVNPLCSQIHSDNIMELTLKQAKDMGRRICENCKKKKQRIDSK
ncbi:TadE/TadG family type IV pilus assembly protein [Vallitalea guaymasensis]|uniref:Pilus assembly protein n=1 Tax=Vallitalea guaymasensis TaxID=1185412 RepID=A0A8J8MCA5_9FIRM|nr:TadE family protein [Vallitalea guaymasensis]QUH30332.1 pilus assembly protein [Vallitalea guaymasensis]